MKLVKDTPSTFIPPPDQVCEVLRPALQRVWAAVEVGVQRTVEFFAEQGRLVDASLAPNLVRYFAKLYLDENDLPSEIEQDFERQHLGNNGLLVKYGPHFLRVLKSDDGRPPVPGRSAAKQDFYQQPLPDIGLTDPEEELKPLRVLVLWDALPKTYAFDGMSVVLPRAGGETRPSVQWHWQRIITEAFVGQPLAPMMPTAQTMIEDLPITKKSPAATGTADGGHED